MSLPVENLCEKTNDGVRLPDVVYSLLIEKYFDHASCAAVAESGKLIGFSPLYKASRSWKGFLINEQSFFFTPTSWSLFIKEHITLSSIKIFNINNVYWLPGELLFNTILSMPNLEELSIKGTQVCTVRQVVKILQTCQKITKLDFTYKEKTQEELTDALKGSEEGSFLSVDGFQKLTSLKLSTTVSEFDGLKDPWIVIIVILSFCRDCTDLGIEVTYAGKLLSPSECLDGLGSDPFGQVPAQFLAQFQGRAASKAAAEDWLPKLATRLAWMKSLESVVLIKLGPNATLDAGERVISLLLDYLVRDYLFPRETPSRLRRFWIQDFEVHRCPALRYSSRDCLQSYRSGDCGAFGDENYESFLNIEHLGGMIGIEFSHPLPSLPKLKYASGTSYDDGEFFKFCEAHPELEDVSVAHMCFRLDLVNDALCQLPKLKTFTCQRLISQEFVEAMTEAYPIVEELRLTTYRHKTIPPRHPPILSAFRFPHLTFLSLSNFQLLDGAALLPIIKECPKLEVVHLDTDALDSASFPSNLELFVRPATKLRDFRLVFKNKEDAYPSTAYSILKALSKGSALLERVALIDGGSEKLADWKPPPEFAHFFLNFLLKMTHMTCLCVTFNQLDVDLMKEIKQHVEEEIVTDRPSLWFYMNRSLPEASDPGVPPIHYHGIVNPISFVMPRF